MDSEAELEIDNSPTSVQQRTTMSVDFLAPKPIQDGSDLFNQKTSFKEEFELFLRAAEKSTSDDKIKVAIMLRCIGHGNFQIVHVH